MSLKIPQYLECVASHQYLVKYKLLKIAPAKSVAARVD